MTIVSIFFNACGMKKLLGVTYLERKHYWINRNQYQLKSNKWVSINKQFIMISCSELTYHDIDR